MSTEKLPNEIFIRDFSHMREAKTLCWDLNALTRIREVVADTAGMIRLTFHFAQHRLGYPMLLGQIEAQLSLICQRTLQKYQQVIDQPLNLVILGREQDWQQLASDEDFYYAADGKVNLIDLVEEELLLALPMIPKQTLDEHTKAKTL